MQYNINYIILTLLHTDTDYNANISPEPQCRVQYSTHESRQNRKFTNINTACAHDDAKL